MSVSDRIAVLFYRVTPWRWMLRDDRLGRFAVWVRSAAWWREEIGTTLGWWLHEYQILPGVSYSYGDKVDPSR